MAGDVKSAKLTRQKQQCAIFFYSKLPLVSKRRGGIFRCGAKAKWHSLLCCVCVYLVGGILPAKLPDLMFTNLCESPPAPPIMPFWGVV